MAGEGSHPSQEREGRGLPPHKPSPTPPPPHTHTHTPAPARAAPPCPRQESYDSGGGGSPAAGDEAVTQWQPNEHAAAGRSGSSAGANPSHPDAAAASQGASGSIMPPARAESQQQTPFHLPSSSGAAEERESSDQTRLQSGGTQLDSDRDGARHRGKGPPTHPPRRPSISTGDDVEAASGASADPLRLANLDVLEVVRDFLR